MCVRAAAANNSHTNKICPAKGRRCVRAETVRQVWPARLPESEGDERAESGNPEIERWFFTFPAL